MEVFLHGDAEIHDCERLLHVRGGVSTAKAAGGFDSQSSPRPWRCFLNRLTKLGTTPVFSTSVEVFLTKARSAQTQACLLHVRGGVSICHLRFGNCKRSSPRPWRCFHVEVLPSECCSVFSTSVEVFPENRHFNSLILGLLHVRGGVSLILIQRNRSKESSPRPWRCFVEVSMATNVELGLLHVRGGVS